MHFNRRFVGTWDSPWQPSVLRTPVALPGHVVLRSRNGHVERLAGREFSQPGDRFRQIDTRRQHLSFAPQSIPTAEGLDVTLTFVLSVRVVDPVLYIQTSAQPEKDVYLAAQIALRALISTVSVDDLVGTRIDLSPVATAAAQVGDTVGLSVAESVQIKDLNLPRAYADALSRAHADKITAEADLERARTEIKITRARMGTAKVLEQNPILAKIRLLEALPPGTTLEVRGEG